MTILTLRTHNTAVENMALLCTKNYENDENAPMSTLTIFSFAPRIFGNYILTPKGSFHNDFRTF